MLNQTSRKTISFLGSIAAAIAIGISSCSESSPNQETDTDALDAQGKPEVVVSSTILCDLTEQIAQETINQTCLLDRQQDPHTYSTTTSDRKAIETAQLILYDGYNLVPAIEKIVESLDNQTSQVAVFEEAVTEPIMAEPHDHGHEDEKGHDHEEEHDPEEEHDHKEKKAAQGEEMEADPHVWHDVKNVIAAVDIIEKELVAANPGEAELYGENAEQLKKQLEKLDSWVKEQVATIPEQKRTLVTTHEAFNYYTQAYGFNSSEALQGLSTEEKPAAADIKALVKTVKETQVPTIFSEVANSDKLIATVAREAGVEVAPESLITEALGEQESKTGTYIDMMINNTCTIVEGLDGQCNDFEK